MNAIQSTTLLPRYRTLPRVEQPLVDTFVPTQQSGLLTSTQGTAFSLGLGSSCVALPTAPDPFCAAGAVAGMALAQHASERSLGVGTAAAAVSELFLPGTGVLFGMGGVMLSEAFKEP